MTTMKTKRDELNSAITSAERAIDRMIKLLVSPDPALTQGAATALCKYGATALVRPQRLYLETRDMRLRQEITYLLAHLEKHGGPPLAPLFEMFQGRCRDPLARIAATSAFQTATASGVAVPSGTVPQGSR